MDLTKLFEATLCVADVRYADKAACLGDLARRAGTAIGLAREAILEALVHREALGSTGLGNGIALPHARLAGLAAPFVLVAKLKTPIAFEALDGRPVDIVCLVLTPASGGTPDAPTVLAKIAKRLRDPAALARLRGAKTPEAVHVAVTA